MIRRMHVNILVIIHLNIVVTLDVLFHKVEVPKACVSQVVYYTHESQLSR